MVAWKCADLFRATVCLCHCLTLVSALALLCGCGSKSSIVPVHGKVMLDGQPLAKGFILTRPESGRGAKGVIANGEFDLGTNADRDGAAIGLHHVAVVAQEGGQDGPEGKAGQLLVPERYTNPDASGLTIDVKAGGTNTPTLELNSP
jgi:hypothetical protein